MSDADTLRRLLEELEGQMAQPMPPALRLEQERALAFGRQTLELIERPEDDLSEVMREELGEVLAKVPRPLRGTTALTEASRYVSIRRDVDPWEVWVRWDQIPTSELRDVVVVLANLWTDIVRRRPLGRPKRSTNRKK